MCVCRFLIDVCSNVALSTFRTVVSRKLTKLVDISCVNLIDSAVLFRWSINSVKESMSPFHVKMSSIKTYPDYNLVGPLLGRMQDFTKGGSDKLPAKGGSH